MPINLYICSGRNTDNDLNLAHNNQAHADYNSTPDEPYIRVLSWLNNALPDNYIH